VKPDLSEREARVAQRQFWLKSEDEVGEPGSRFSLVAFFCVANSKVTIRCAAFAIRVTRHGAFENE